MTEVRGGADSAVMAVCDDSGDAILSAGEEAINAESSGWVTTDVRGYARRVSRS